MLRTTYNQYIINIQKFMNHYETKVIFQTSLQILKKSFQLK